MSEHYHATVKLIVTADTLDEFEAEITIITQRIPDLCREAATQYRKAPTAPAATITLRSLSGAAAVAGVIARHIDPLEN